jgi:histidine triad (HIT) family protein
MNEDNCLFCRIATGQIAAQIIAQDDFCVAFRDINPQAPTHVLIIPRDHIGSLNDLDDPEMMAAMGRMARKIAQDQEIDHSGYRFVINTNADAGQTVFHLHAHVLGGRGMAWPPG